MGPSGRASPCFGTATCSAAGENLPPSSRTRSLRHRPLPDRSRRALGTALIVGAALCLALAAAGLVLGPPWRQAGRLAVLGPSAPSRLYARPRIVELGEQSTPEELEAHLRAVGYWHGVFPGEPSSGAFQRAGDGLRIGRREVPRPDGEAPLPAATVEVRWADGRVSGLGVDGRAVERLALEPALLASLYDESLTEHRPIRWQRLPRHVRQAFLAAEDDRFHRHLGLSLPGILRAAWANLRAGEIVQGGSTITQQVTRTAFLRRGRSWSRKLHEALLAPLIELRNSKETILRAYLDGVYLGSRDGVSLIGVGAAARAFFGKDAADLTLAEAALLAAVVASPGRFDPFVHPEEARARSDTVLARLAELEWQSEAAVHRARAEPLVLVPWRPRARQAPHFVSHVVATLEGEGHGVLGGTGHTVFTSLVERDQRLAEAALREGLAELATDGGGSAGESSPLEAALVSMDPQSGEVLAWVGGRDWERSQFDRVAQARRQAGSAFKPIVYAAALTGGGVQPHHLVADAPLTVELSGTRWRPENDDGAFRGLVTVRRALESSLNVPTVRVALHTGLPAIVEMARLLGIESPLEPVPALALGAFEVSPLELCRAYATLAAGGLRPTVRPVLALSDRAGMPILDLPPPAATKALDPIVDFKLTSMLLGVLERGTGASAGRLGVTGHVAGKTGTSDGGRDAWFAGFTPGRATVVWVGHDEPRPTRLSGSRAALPIWARFHRQVEPPAERPILEMPAELEWVRVDRTTGLLATGDCPEVVAEPLQPWEAPRRSCPLLHGRPGLGPTIPDLRLARPVAAAAADGPEGGLVPSDGAGRELVWLDRDGRWILTQRRLLPPGASRTREVVRRSPPLRP
jgi:penicillin-binding protein 1B